MSRRNRYDQPTRGGKPTAFLRNAIILTLAAAAVSIFMPQWGVPQVLIVVLIGLLAAFQWGLYFFLKN